MYFAPALLATLLVSANALATPHHGSGIHRRHPHAALAKVRAPVPEPVPQPLEASAATPNRRLRKRCQPRKSSVAPSVPSTAASSSAAPASSSAAPPPVNVAPAPKPSSSANVATPSPPPPAPSPPPSPSPTSSSSQAAAPTPSSSNGGSTSSIFSGSQSGQGTFYTPGLGACGHGNTESDPIVAVSHILFDTYPGYNNANPNTNPVCGKQVLIEYQGKQVTATIVDRCVGCLQTDLDLSPELFNQLASPTVGRIDMTWRWL